MNALNDEEEKTKVYVHVYNIQSITNISRLMVYGRPKSNKNYLKKQQNQSQQIYKVTARETLVYPWHAIHA